jgi:hypothetical protein
MVAMSVWPTDASDGSVATEARWRKMGRVWAGTGVVIGQAGNMVPTLAGTNLTVKAGACWVDGHYCELAADTVLTVTANGIAVVRFDPAANTAELLYRDGITTPAQSPTGTFEMVVGSIAGGVLTDARAAIKPGKMTQAVVAPVGSLTAPYSGGWGAADRDIQVRSGHVGVNTSSFGDGTFSFATPFPNGVLSCVITPYQPNSDVYWFPVVVSVTVAGVHFFACAPSGYPFASGHPPGLANVWTVTGFLTFDYLAIGV